ncbi:NAD(P)/FAD-dependent oxidoreductase [Yoonia litorea]|uniref:Thioredoxin reductase n=1 Tax=Yoonia litorea TaxID=1123755 RepID=A0A1I6LE20_9RHOB|nr:NAD(P)/FAD-dependent oxidoreductase [Yoonia litorea]SFS01699.1 Thioredoxin reductase [Yoonia litorea]
MDHVDVVVIGGSFAGMSAALQLGRARQSVKVFDTKKPRNRFAPTAHGFLGHDGRTPAEIRELGRDNLAQYPTVEVVEARVATAAQEGEGFIVHPEGSAPIKASCLVLAYGLRDELPMIEGLNEAWGRNVMQCPYCHGYEVRDRKLGVLYTSEASLHQAKIIPDWSADVTLFTNGQAINRDAIAAVESRGVVIVADRVIGLELEEGWMRRIILQEHNHDLDGLFVITKTHHSSDLAGQLGCAFEEGPFGPYIRVDNLQETSIPGVFAAGDIARPIHQSVWAAADGSAAGAFCHQSLLSQRNPYHKPAA